MFWFRWRLADIITEKLAGTPAQLQWRKSLLTSALRWLATTYKEHKSSVEKNEETMLQRLQTLLVCSDHDYVNVSCSCHSWQMPNSQFQFSCWLYWGSTVQNDLNSVSVRLISEFKSHPIAYLFIMIII